MPQHPLGGTQRGAGHSHSGGCGPHPFPWGQAVAWCLWRLLGIRHALLCQLFHWRCCPCCPSPSHCLLHAWAGDQQPFPSPGSVFQLLGLIHLVGDTMSYSAGFALLLAVEMQEQDEETGPSMRLWGRIRCWAMGWLAAGHRVAQHPGDASIHRAGGAARRRLLQKVLQLMGICSSGTDRSGSPPGAR